MQVLFLLHGRLGSNVSSAMLIVKEFFNSSGSRNKPKTQRLLRHTMWLFVGGPRVREVLKKIIIHQWSKILLK